MLLRVRYPELKSFSRSDPISCHNQKITMSKDHATPFCETSLGLPQVLRILECRLNNNCRYNLSNGNSRGALVLFYDSPLRLGATVFGSTSSEFLLKRVLWSLTIGRSSVEIDARGTSKKMLIIHDYRISYRLMPPCHFFPPSSLYALSPLDLSGNLEGRHRAR